MFPTVKGQKFTHKISTEYESRGLCVLSFGVVNDDTEYATLSELLAKNPINRSITVFIAGGGACSITSCTVEW